jgi:hypothetical protein
VLVLVVVIVLQVVQVVVLLDLVTMERGMLLRVEVVDKIVQKHKAGMVVFHFHGTVRVRMVVLQRLHAEMHPDITVVMVVMDHALVGTV